MAFGCVIETNQGLAPDITGRAAVMVVERIGVGTHWELQMDARVDGGDIPDFLDARFDPGQVVSIFADDGLAGIDCLVTGEVLGQRLVVVHGSEGSAMTVFGGDTTVAMDREVKTTIWEGLLMTDAAIVLSILPGYALVPAVDPTLAVRPPAGHPLVQRKSDLALIRQLARRNGCLFWITPMAAAVGPIAQIAHFAPPTFADGPGLGELRLNQQANALTGDPNTIDSISIEFDASAPTEVKADGVGIAGVDSFNADTNLDAMTPLGTTAVKDIGPSPRSHRLTTASDTAGDLLPKGTGVLNEAQFFIRARCTTTRKRLGKVLHAHDTVRIMGAGSRHSGRYYVQQVIHRLDDEAHWMDLTLVRNAWGEEPGGLGGLV